MAVIVLIFKIALFVVSYVCIGFVMGIFSATKGKTSSEWREYCDNDDETLLPTILAWVVLWPLKLVYNLINTIVNWIMN